jgi:hypothetical protein
MKCVLHNLLSHNFSNLHLYPQLIMATLTNILQGELPVQSAVYVIFALREKAIHVISRDVSSKYTIMQGLSADTQATIRGHMNQATIRGHKSSLPLDGGDDKAGFYNGIDSSALFELIQAQPIHGTDAAQADLYSLPYTRFSIPQDMLQGCINPSPEIEEQAYGPLELVACGGGQSTLAVSLSRWPSGYAVLKIDQLCAICKYELGDSTFMPETILSAKLNSFDLERVRTSAVNLVRDVLPHSGGYEPIPDNYDFIFQTSKAQAWPIIMHSHIVQN